MRCCSAAPVTKGLCQVFQWHKGDMQWRLSARGASVLASCAFAALSLGIVGLALRSQKPMDLFEATDVGINITTLVVTWLAFAGYLYVARRAVRSSQLHLHGLALLGLLMSSLFYTLAEAPALHEACVARDLAMAVCIVLLGGTKCAIFIMIRQKMISCGAPAGCCCVPADSWPAALIVVLLGTVAAGALTLAWGAVVVLRGHPCEETLQEVFAGAPNLADKVIVKLLYFTLVVGAIGVLIAGIGTICAANQQRRRTLSELSERQVQGKELRKVQAVLTRHVVGMFMTVTSIQMAIVVRILDSLNVLSMHEYLEELLGDVTWSVDALGDVGGILLLSGIGVLLLREDPIAGDCSGHIQSVLHSAVLTSRAATVFEGRVDEGEPGSICIASFPGHCSPRELCGSPRECVEETWRQLSALRTQGLIHNLGVSNFGPRRIQELQALELAPVSVNQVEYHPWIPDLHRQTVSWCHRNHIAVTAYFPLGGSWAVKTTLGAKILQALAAAHGRTPSQVLLRWSAQKNLSAIPGTGDPQHMRENLAIYDFELSPAEMAAIDAEHFRVAIMKSFMVYLEQE